MQPIIFDGNSKDNFSYFNKRLLNYKPESFSVKYFDNIVLVNLVSGFIFINGELVYKPDLNLSNFRFISFRKCSTSLNMVNGKEDLVLGYFVGFQANDKKGNNIKKTVRLTKEGWNFEDK